MLLDTNMANLLANGDIFSKTYKIDMKINLIVWSYQIKKGIHISHYSKTTNAVTNSLHTTGSQRNYCKNILELFQIA